MTQDCLPAEHHVVVTGVPQGCPDEALESHFDKEWHGGCGDVVRVVRPYGGKDPAIALVVFKHPGTADKVVTFGDHTIGRVKVNVEKLSEPFAEYSATLNKKKILWDSEAKAYLGDHVGLKITESSDGAVVIRGSYWQVYEAKTYLSNPDSKGAGEDSATSTASVRKKKNNILASKSGSSAEAKREEDTAPGICVDKPASATEGGESKAGRNRGASRGDDKEEFHDTVENLEKRNDATGQDTGGSGKLQRQRSSDSTQKGTRKSDNAGGNNNGVSRDAGAVEKDVVHRSPTQGSSRSGSSRPASLYPNLNDLNVHGSGATGTRRSYARDDASVSPHEPMDVDEHRYQSLQPDFARGTAWYDRPHITNAVSLRGRNNTIIQIYKADLTRLPVDVIVSPVGVYLEGGAVASAIRRAAGLRYSDALQDAKFKVPTLRHAHVVTTLGFDLSCKLVFHIRSPDGLDDLAIYKDPKGDKKQLEDAVLAILNEADRGGDIKSVAIPAIGTGAGAMSAREAAPIFVKTACDFPATSLQEIHLVDFNETTVSALKIEARKIQGDGGGTS